MNSLTLILRLTSISIGVELCRVFASDADIGSNGRVRYAITGSSSGAATFHVDELTGVVIAIQRLDRELREHYVIRVTASDGEGGGNHHDDVIGGVVRSSTALILLAVLDEDDDRATFDVGSYTFRPEESVRVGSELGSVRATDRDLAPYNVFSYRLLQPSGQAEDTWFSVNRHNGAITLLRPLDAELWPAYTLTVRAENPEGRGASVRVEVLVRDVNEYTPRWVAPLETHLRYVNVTIQVDVATSVGSKVIQFKATDKDRTATVTYGLRSSGIASRTFDLDLVSGILTLRNALSQGHMYELMVTASDQDSRNTTMKVTMIAEVISTSQLQVNTTVICI